MWCRLDDKCSSWRALYDCCHRGGHVTGWATNPCRRDNPWWDPAPMTMDAPPDAIWGGNSWPHWCRDRPSHRPRSGNTNCPIASPGVVHWKLQKEKPKIKNNEEFMAACPSCLWTHIVVVQWIRIWAASNWHWHHRCAGRAWSFPNRSPAGCRVYDCDATPRRRIRNVMWCWAISTHCPACWNHCQQQLKYSSVVYRRLWLVSALPAPWEELKWVKDQDWVIICSAAYLILTYHWWPDNACPAWCSRRHRHIRRTLAYCGTVDHRCPAHCTHHSPHNVWHSHSQALGRQHSSSGHPVASTCSCSCSSGPHRRRSAYLLRA